MALLNVWGPSSTAAALAQATAPGRLDDTPRVILISAYEPEMDDLRDELDLEDTYVIHGRSYYVGKLAGMDGVLVLSGISMVNAQMVAGVESEAGYSGNGGVDTEESVAAKAEFVREHDLMGMFSWRLDIDMRTEDGETEGGPATYQVAGWVYEEMGR